MCIGASINTRLTALHRYVEDESIDLKFAPHFVDYEDEAGETTTKVHFAILPRRPRRGRE